MKNISVIIVVIVILSMCSSCAYNAYIDYYDEVDYAEIWELAGFRHGYDGSSNFFPQTIEELQVEEFFCRYDQQLPLGEGVQVFLKINYEADAFEKESMRISSLAFNCDDLFVDSGLSAYATRIGVDYVSEYALIDSSSKTIYYIILQNLPVNEIEFNHVFLPTGYTDYFNGYVGDIETTNFLNERGLTGTNMLIELK